MGTSKGYIAPTSPTWSSSKRDVTSYITNPTEKNKIDAAAGYSKAIRNSNYGGQAIKVFSGFASFVSSSKSHGIRVALREIQQEQLLVLPPEEAINDLLLYFSDGGNTIENNIALDCLSEAIEVLEIKDLTDLESIDTNTLIRELVCQFAKLKFAQTYDQHIRQKCPTPELANSRIQEMQEFIYYTTRDKLTDLVVAAINPHNLSDECVVKDVLDEAFRIMEQYYV